MEETTTFLSQSRFYSPVFNAAIFDGPLKIYFSQTLESGALEIYSRLHKNFGLTDKPSDRDSVLAMKKVYLMYYPDQESFEMSFPKSAYSIEIDKLGDDLVIGICGPRVDLQADHLHRQIEDLIRYGIHSVIQTQVIAAAP